LGALGEHRDANLHRHFLAGLLIDLQTVPIRVNVRMVQVKVIARNSSVEPVTDLTNDDFEILDNGKPQVVRFFALEMWPLHPVPSAPLPQGVFSHRVQTNPKAIPCHFTN